MCVSLWLSLSILLFSSFSSLPSVSAQQPNQFDQILSELDALTRQQLSQASRQPATTTASPSGSTSGSSSTTTAKPEIIKKIVRSSSSLSSSSPSKASPKSSKLVSETGSKDSFALPGKYDPNELPRYRRGLPLPVSMNITFLDSFVDRSESTLIVDLEIRQSWRDSRLRLRKKSSDEDENVEPEEEAEQKSVSESHLLTSEWSARLWHPVARLLGKGQIVQPSESSSSSSTRDNVSRTSPTGSGHKFQALEDEASIESLVVFQNRSTARMTMSIKLRISTPMYDCARDNPKRYPFDRITCKVSFANGESFGTLF